jgi:predicted HNH restriction endonuclease
VSLPHYLTRENILEGIRFIDVHGVPKKREATRYALVWNSADYPPKYVICVAHRSFDGTEYQNIFSGGSEANNFLIALGFKIRNKETGKWVGVEPVTEDEAKVFEEGRFAYAKHLKYERNPKIARLAKEKRLSEKKELRCDVCGFSFEETYGTQGTGYIEAHHTIPVSQMTKLKQKTTRLADIALVCSNCHRMLHRRTPWLEIDRLKELLAKPSGSL